MTDKADSAKAYEDKFTAAALARQAPAQVLPPYEGPCVLCGDDIPAERKQAAPAARLCITCATDTPQNKDRR